MVKVTFFYDEVLRKWEPIVEGVKDNTEARQAFSAVVLTCQELNPSLLVHAKTEPWSDPKGWKIIPAV